VHRGSRLAARVSLAINNRLVRLDTVWIPQAVFGKHAKLVAGSQDGRQSIFAENVEAIACP
jgi:hypothetical protein